MNPPISVIVTPRDGHHYQDLLYKNIESSGIRVHFDEGPTRSQTLNVLLAPFILARRRAQHFRILHIHWVFHFSLPWARHASWARRLMQWWFGLYLGVAHLLGYKIVWTAHDLLPHEQVFSDDRRVRDMLISRATTVIALSGATARELAALGAHNVSVIPMGTYSEPYPIVSTSDEARSSLGFGEDDVVFGLIGRLERYKGVDLLLSAAAQLPATSPCKFLIVGLCPDDTYRLELMRLADSLPGKVTTRFEWVPNDDLARYFQAIDVAVFPFREITNSASVLLAQAFGRPVIIPDIAALSDIPASGAIRFSPSVGQEVGPLVAALRRAEELTNSEYDGMSAAALAWATRNDWPTVAHETAVVYRQALL